MSQYPPTALHSSSAEIYSWQQRTTFSWNNTMNLPLKCTFYLKFAIKKAPILPWSKQKSILCSIVTQTLKTNTTKDSTWLWSYSNKMIFQMKQESLRLIGHTKDGNKKASTFTWWGTQSVWKIKKLTFREWIWTENTFISKMNLRIIKRKPKEDTAEALCLKYKKIQREKMLRLQVYTKVHW